MEKVKFIFGRENFCGGKKKDFSSDTKIVMGSKLKVSLRIRTRIATRSLASQPVDLIKMRLNQY